jgi:hypothetical protein
MTSIPRCPHHVVAVAFCTICVGLPVFGSFAETSPDTVVAIAGSNQPIPEPDNPSDPAGGGFLIPPVVSFVSNTSTMPSEKILSIYNLLSTKLK